MQDYDPKDYEFFQPDNTEGVPCCTDPPPADGPSIEKNPLDGERTGEKPRLSDLVKLAEADLRQRELWYNRP